jgi:hypothetical protein
VTGVDGNLEFLIGITPPRQTMSYGSLYRLSFWLHSLIELVPSIGFLVNPAAQLYISKITPDLQITSKCYNSGIPKPGAEAIIRQYAVLLFVSVLISAIFAMRQIDTTSRQVAAALALYHLAPTTRAAIRLWTGETAWLPKDMGGPWVHLAVHIVCLLALGSLALGISDPKKSRQDPRMPTKRE